MTSADVANMLALFLDRAYLAQITRQQTVTGSEQIHIVMASGRAFNITVTEARKA